MNIKHAAIIIIIIGIILLLIVCSREIVKTITGGGNDDLKDDDWRKIENDLNKLEKSVDEDTTIANKLLDDTVKILNFEELLMEKEDTQTLYQEFLFIERRVKNNSALLDKINQIINDSEMVYPADSPTLKTNVSQHIYIPRANSEMRFDIANEDIYDISPKRYSNIKTNSTATFAKKQIEAKASFDNTNELNLDNEVHSTPEHVSNAYKPRKSASFNNSKNTSIDPRNFEVDNEKSDSWSNTSFEKIYSRDDFESTNNSQNMKTTNNSESTNNSQNMTSTNNTGQTILEKIHNQLDGGITSQKHLEYSTISTRILKKINANNDVLLQISKNLEIIDANNHTMLFLELMQINKKINELLNSASVLMSFDVKNNVSDFKNLSQIANDIYAQINEACSRVELIYEKIYEVSYFVSRVYNLYVETVYKINKLHAILFAFYQNYYVYLTDLSNGKLEVLNELTQKLDNLTTKLNEYKKKLEK